MQWAAFWSVQIRLTNRATCATHSQLSSPASMSKVPCLVLAFCARAWLRVSAALSSDPCMLVLAPVNFAAPSARYDSL